MTETEWISECKIKNPPVSIKTNGGYSYAQVQNNKNCAKDIEYWFNIEGTDRYLFRSKTAESWEFFDPDIENPIRNTNQIYIKMLDLSDFITAANYFRKHKVYTHAIRNTISFVSYWTDEENKCLNGLVSNGVYITGRYYFLLNFGFFKAFPVDELGNQVGKSKKITLLRFVDLQYYLFHELEECWMSGKYGHLDEFLEWFPELTEDDFLELKYLFFAASKGRRKGWSASVGIGGIAYNFIHLPESKSICGAEEKSHYRPMQKGIKDTLNAINKNTPWKRPVGIKGTADHFISGKKELQDDGTIKEIGYKSEVEYIAFADAFRGIGESADLLNIEEPGKFTKLIDTLKVSVEPVLREGNTPIGPCILGGTAGDMESGGSMALQQIMYNPTANGFKAYDNIYEKTEVTTQSGWFIDDLWFLTGHKTKAAFLELDNSDRGKLYCDKAKGRLILAVDKFGNSYRYVAKVFLEEKRAKERKASASAYKLHITQQPMYLAEAFLLSTDSPFDTALAQEALAELILHESTMSIEKGIFVDKGSVGGKPRIDWKLDMSLQHINSWPWKEDNKDGSWVIFAHPVKQHKYISPDDRLDAELRNSRGDLSVSSDPEFIMNYRYIAGTDPIDIGTGESKSTTNKHSLACTWILDTVTRNIVAVYIARPYLAATYFDNVIKGLEYYNAICNVERNIKGMISHFKYKNKSYLISDELQSTKDKVEIRKNINPLKGTVASSAINTMARELIHTWTTELTSFGLDSNGEEIMRPRMFAIPSIFLLQELLNWSPDGNFDGISALGMLMLLLYDKDYEIFTKNTQVDSMLNKGMFRKMKKAVELKNKRHTYNTNGKRNFKNIR